MINIIKFIIENRKEARKIVEKKGGRINFVELENDEEWDGNPMEEVVPWVVVGYDEGFIDTAVLAVRVSNDDPDGIEFLAYDNVASCIYGWVGSCECCIYSDNAVYEFLGD